MERQGSLQNVKILPQHRHHPNLTSSTSRFLAAMMFRVVVEDVDDELVAALLLEA